MNSETQFISSGDTDTTCMTGYKNYPVSAFLEPDCNQIPHDPDTVRVSTSNLLQKPTEINAFPGMSHNGNPLFQPQPIRPAEHHHHMLDQEHPSPRLQGHFEEAPDGGSGHMSEPEFTTPHGALPAPLASSSPNSVVPDLKQFHSTLDHYLSCQNASSDFRYPPRKPFELHSVPQAGIGHMLSPTSVEPSGRCQNSWQSLPGHAFNSSKRKLLSYEESQLGRDSPVVKTSRSTCALVNGAPNGPQLLQKPFHPTQFNNSSRSTTLGLDSAPEVGQPNLVDQTVVATEPAVTWHQYQCGQVMDESPSPSRRAQAAAQTTFEHGMRHRKDTVTPRDWVLEPDLLISSCRTDVLTKKTTYQHTSPLMHDNVNRPGNCGLGEGGPGSPQVKNAYKMNRIRSMERALNAVKTLSMYLSQEGIEASEQGDKRRGTSARRRALGSPQEFLMLGELGGKLKRLLEEERRSRCHHFDSCDN